MSTPAVPPIGATENQTTEFKRIYHSANPNIVTEIAKDVAAIASARGGILWIGVVEENEAVTEYAPLTPESRLDHEDRIAGAVRSRCTPPPSYDFHRVKLDEEGELLAMEIGAAGQPVAVRMSNERDAAYVFPIRSGTQTVYRAPDLADHAHARQFALQMLQIPLGDTIALGEYRPVYRGTPAPSRVLKKVDLESLTFDLGFVGDPLSNVTMRCKDVAVVWKPGGGETRWQLDVHSVAGAQRRW